MTLDDTTQRTAALVTDLRESLPLEFQDDSLSQLLADIRSSISTVVVIGEFNRGKSSLVNAVLGQDLLPCDVLPTTAALHVIRWAPVSVLRAHLKSGGHSDRSLSAEELKRFVAGASLAPDQNLSYIEIGIPLPVLRALAIVDTPGVGDMNQQRTEVTYNFVPRADVVIFVLDATTAVRRSEIEFLESAVLSSGIERIIFVANSSDGLDFDKRDATLAAIRNRLRSALGGREVRVLLFSATQALEAIRSGNKHMIAESGLATLLQDIERIRNQSATAYERSLHFIARADVASRKCDAVLQAAAEALDSSDADLAVCIRKMDLVISGVDRTRTELRQWAECRRNELLTMTTKSLATFTAELLSDVRTTIWEYNGPQLKDLVEQRIPRMVRRRYKDWIETHSPSIRRVLIQIDARLCNAVSHYCKRTVSSGARNLAGLAFNDASSDFGVTMEDASFTGIKAGLVTALAAGMLMVIGAPVLVPLVSLAGFPLLSRLWSDRKLREAKEGVGAAFDLAIEKSALNFTAAVLSALGQDINTLVRAAESQLDQSLNVTTRQAESEVRKRKSQDHDDRLRRQRIGAARESVAAVIAELQVMRIHHQATGDLAHA